MKSLEQIEDGTYEGIIMNDSLVLRYYDSFIYELKRNNIQFEKKLDKLNFIFIEPESDKPLELIGFNLAKTDKDKNLILLSRVCLIDRYILKVILYRELSHYIGLPYNLKDSAFMKLNKPKGYSYAWASDYDITEVELGILMNALKELEP
jgi:hypothetical protein